YTIMLIALIVAAIAPTAAKLVRLIYPGSYQPAAEPLSILIFGIGFFALFSVLASLVSGYGKPVMPTAIALLALLLDFALNAALIPAFGLDGAALASTISMFFALVAMAAYTIFLFRAFCSRLSIARIAIAGAVVFAAGALLPFGGVLLLPAYAGLALLYAGVLFALGELGRKDLALLKSIVSPAAGQSIGDSMGAN
ncbi:MAG: polysaccharide biosynthesis C-terminal domain-containing protein, partial [Candidatus Diapherotrites archaeon]|nr:polysaccharide biosynthesis C-terminal domain-containing protein [Candidatus Diapherotrites archaeon]